MNRKFTVVAYNKNNTQKWIFSSFYKYNGMDEKTGGSFTKLMEISFYSRIILQLTHTHEYCEIILFRRIYIIYIYYQNKSNYILSLYNHHQHV